MVSMADGKNLRIKISGYPARCADAARKLLDGTFIDIADVDEIGPNYLRVAADPSIDLGDTASYEWVKNLIDETLRRHWIYAQFELIRLPDEDAL